jgi:hypothetical protein
VHYLLKTCLFWATLSAKSGINKKSYVLVQCVCTLRNIVCLEWGSPTLSGDLLRVFERESKLSLCSFTYRFEPQGVLIPMLYKIKMTTLWTYLISCLEWDTCVSPHFITHIIVHILRIRTIAFVPRVGIEPTCLSAHDFESCVYTSSTIEACCTAV